MQAIAQTGHRGSWIIFLTGLLLGATGPVHAQGEKTPASLRLPRHVPPVMAVWGWRESDFAPEGYRGHIDMMARHSAVNLLMTTIRAPGKLVTDEAVREQIRQAAMYASRHGIRLAMDLDVRLARESFRDAYPDEMQEMLRLREVALKDTGEVQLTVFGDELSDHYTFSATPYVPLSGRLVRAYTYTRGPGGIRPDSLQDITAQCAATNPAARTLAVSIHCKSGMADRTACVIVAFSHLAADAFAPHLLPFQRRILESYRDVPLAGACKDEWGFPPCFDGNPPHNDYWYSSAMAKAYTDATGGRDLVRDCVLMTFGENGREAERWTAINRFNRLVRDRHAAIEADFHAAAKSVWGPGAVVATHPTWWPYPDRREFKKNGLDWWVVKRDLAQVDEITPYCVRTALAKKLNSPAWYNMYYSPNVADYHAELWADALTGGRIDYHALWPVDSSMPNEERYQALLRGGLMRGDCRARLLNFITQSALDCPVAVVFGQACAMNWAGPAYEDVGLSLADALWQIGYPADLIPAEEIAAGALSIGSEGAVQYGGQRYHSVVLYHPEFEPGQTSEFFRRAASGKTALYRMGDWRHDPDGKAFDGSVALPEEMSVLTDVKQAVERVVRQLESAGVQKQAPADRMIGFGDCRSVAPPAAGMCRLVDGTHVFVSGTQQASGDPLHKSVLINGHDVAFDAIGLFAVRLNQQGRVEAVAAGGLKSFTAGDLSIDMPTRADIAIWRDDRGAFHGVLQDYAGELPQSLRALTTDWLRLTVPDPA